MARFRRVARDYERLAETLAGLHYVAFAMLILMRMSILCCLLKCITRSRVLPHHQTGLSPSNAHGARNARGNSVAQRLQLRAFDKDDQVKASGHGVYTPDD